MTERWVTFDCYGTLVDWMGGIRSTLSRLWPKADPSGLLGLYMRIEPTVQEGRAIPYREVMAETLGAIAVTEGLPLYRADREALAESLPAWPVFLDVPASLERLRDRGWKLAILSNTDPDLLEASIASIGVPIDAQVTAAEAGSYKPAPGHWEAFFDRTGAPREGHVHVAASLFHDIAPAAELGLRAVWINRLAETSELPRAGELPDLSGLADCLDGLIPG
jgi:2-haloalkanoic acid dehalogenase type II